MRKLLVLALLAAAVLVPARAAAAAKPLVPAFVQQLVAKRAPALAYVPARGAIPYRYRNFKVQRGVLRIWFANRNEPSKTILFSARAFRGTCRAGASKSFQMAGVKTWYGSDGATQRAWRCLHGRKLTASTTMGPRRFADAGLARIAASGHRVR
jgi:hypothetical protein